MPKSKRYTVTIKKFGWFYCHCDCCGSRYENDSFWKVVIESVIIYTPNNQRKFLICRNCASNKEQAELLVWKLEDEYLNIKKKLNGINLKFIKKEYFQKEENNVSE